MPLAIRSSVGHSYTIDDEKRRGDFNSQTARFQERNASSRLLEYRAVDSVLFSYRGAEHSVTVMSINSNRGVHHCD